MRNATVEAKSKKDAEKKCLAEFGWFPDAVRRVDSGDENTKAWMCFESAQDAKLWDRQK